MVTAEHPRPRLGVVRRLHSEERGVVTIIATLTLLALIGMLALGVDVGYAYGQRRLAQNVADSGAMAAAWVISDSLMGNSHTDTDVLNAIRDVAKNSSGGFYKTTTSCTYNGAFDSFTAYYVADADKNGVPEELNIQVGTTCNGPIPSAASGIRVIPAKTNAAFFASVLGFQTVAAGARATALARDIIAYSDYAPYAVWGGNSKEDSPSVNPDERCKDPSGSYLSPDHSATVASFNDAYLYGCLPVGLTVTYQSNNYQNANVQPNNGNPRWGVGSSSMKGFLHKNVDPLYIGQTIYAAGNAFGDSQPIDMLHDCYMQTATHPSDPCILVMPVITHGWAQGTNVVLYVSNFAEVKLTNDPAANGNNSWTAQILKTPLPNSNVAVGACPSTGVPCSRTIRLVQ